MADLALVLDLARRGFALFPVEARGKRPAAGVRWTEWATTDPAVLAETFGNDGLNVGVAAGPSGLVIIDEDRPDLLVAYAHPIGQTVPPTFTVRTAKGRHYYFRSPAGLALSNSRGRLPQGIDVRGSGGYVVGPGSVHQTGVAYAIENDLAPAGLPDWLRAELSEAVERTETDVDVTAWLAQQDGPMCSIVADAADRHVRELPGSRHDGMLRGQRNLVELGVKGHRGAGEALQTLRDAFTAELANSPGRDVAGEWNRALAGAVRQSGAWTSNLFQGPRCGHDEPREPVSTVTALGSDDQASRPALEFSTLAELCARVDAAGPRRYLIRGIWPAGAYGVHAAEMKAQKTWNAFDAAVSVASGTDWLGAFPADDPGPVVIFIGEGGEAGLVRRLRAICVSRGLRAEDLPVTVCPRAPHLSNDAHMLAFREHVESIRPKLVLLDPLYLSLGGADGRDLYAMGQVLERPQLVCDRLGAALMAVTHFNRGNRTGAGRITGAGPAEWGRVIIGAEVKSRHTDPVTKASTVISVLDVMGGEIPDQEFRIKRTIYADDPDDLDSQLHYAVEVVEAGDGETGREDDMPPARRKLLDAVTALAKPSEQRELVDWIAANHGHGLYRTTASRELNALRGGGLVDCIEESGRPSLWYLCSGVVSTGQAHPSTGDSGGVSPLSPHISDSDTPTPQSDRSGVSPTETAGRTAPDGAVCQWCGTPIPIDQHYCTRVHAEAHRRFVDEPED